MSGPEKLRVAIIAILWLFLAALVVRTARPVTLQTVAVIVASGIVVFVPLYKKYKKHGN